MFLLVNQKPAKDSDFIVDFSFSQQMSYLLMTAIWQRFINGVNDETNRSYAQPAEFQEWHFLEYWPDLPLLACGLYVMSCLVFSVLCATIIGL